MGRDDADGSAVLAGEVALPQRDDRPFAQAELPQGAENPGQFAHAVLGHKLVADLLRGERAGGVGEDEVALGGVVRPVEAPRAPAADPRPGATETTIILPRLQYFFSIVEISAARPVAFRIKGDFG